MITYAIINEKGERNYQEDSVDAFSNESIYAFWVADGLGGHGNGKEASASVINLAGECLQRFENSDQYLQSVFTKGNQLLHDMQDNLKNKETLKTTLVGCVVNGNQMTWAHAGDSRFYLFVQDKIVIRTLDHSVPQMLVLGGQIQETEIRNHPDRNRVLRVLGNRDQKAEMDLGRTVLVENGMKVLLCTDGFWEWIEEKDMEQILSDSHDPDEWLEKMKNHIKQNGIGKGMDNYSALAVWF